MPHIFRLSNLVRAYLVMGGKNIFSKKKTKEERKKEKSRKMLKEERERARKREKPFLLHGSREGK